MKKFVPQIILLGFSLLLMAGVGELVLRLTIGPPIIWRYPQEHYERDAELGYRLAPNQTSFTHDKLFETNSEGLRGPDAPHTPPDGSSRLLALGDSQTSGDGLLLADTWPAQLATQLSEMDPAADWEVLNAGLSGASPWQYSILLERLAEVYAFDGVAVALYVNDVTPRPKSPGVYVVTNTLSRRIGYVLKRSAVFTAIWRARRQLTAALIPGKSSDLERRILTGEDHPMLELGWRDLETSLRGIRDFTEKRRMGLWLIVLPRRDQVAGGEAGRAYNRRNAEIAERLGIPYVDVLGSLVVEYASVGQRLFIAWDGHNSALANRVISHQLAKRILSTR